MTDHPVHARADHDATPDEFALLRDNADEAGLTWSGPPSVRRITAAVAGRAVSALAWGEATPRLVFLHGGGQNAHTWDTVLLTMLATDPDLGAIAVDLPGHGRSDWRTDHDYGPAANANTLAAVLRRLAPAAGGVVGMSLGGLTAMRLAAVAPDLVRSAVIVDVTPNSPSRRTAAGPVDRGAVALLDGPAEYASFDAMFDAVVAAAPGRRRSSLRRGVLHNAKETSAGTWVWRYDNERGIGDTGDLWSDIDASSAPMTLVRGGASPFVTDDDAAEFARRKPGLVVHVVAHAGHSVQSDAPAELSSIIRAATG